MSSSLRVLSMNVWGLPYGKDLAPRMAKLCAVLAANDQPGTNTAFLLFFNNSRGAGGPAKCARAAC